MLKFLIRTLPPVNVCTGIVCMIQNVIFYHLKPHWGFVVFFSCGLFTFLMGVLGLILRKRV